MQGKTLRSPRSLVLLVLAVALGLGALLVAGRDPAAQLAAFGTHFLAIFVEALPFLLLGALISGLLDSFVLPGDIARLMPRNAVLAALLGAAIGLFFPVGECGVVPVARRLTIKGLPLQAGIAFLLAAPVINPIVLASTYAAFGFGPLLIGRFLLTGAVAVITGLIFALAARPQDALRPDVLALTPPAGETPPAEARRLAFGPGLRHALTTAGRDFLVFGRYLLLGAVLAAAVQTLIPPEALTEHGGPLLPVLGLLALAFILSISPLSDTTFALSLTGAIAPGSLLAFLILGPMVDLKSAVLFLGLYKPKAVVFLVIIPLLLIFWAGVWLNLNGAL